MAEESAAKPAKPASKSAPIADVAQPGKSAPSSTSKSIIINHRPIVKDPMVNAEKPKEVADPAVPTADDAQKLSSTKEQTVEPTAAAKEAETKPAPDAEPEKPKPKEPTDPAHGDEPEATEPKDPAVDEEAEANKRAEHDASIQKLADSKKYYLPINSVEKRRSRRVVILGILLSIILALAWVDVALDAGLIQVDNVKPVTHFFSN